MKLKKVMWHIISVLSSVIIIVFVLGLIISIYIVSSGKHIGKSKFAVQTNAREVFKSSSDVYNLLVMGDSLAKGTGDENNKGFAGYFADSLKAKIKKKVNVNNIAVNGDVSDGLLKIVKRNETSDLIKNANIIFISIGGNEIKKFAASSPAAMTVEIKNTEGTYLSNLKNILESIREKNNKCKIVFIGLYNPFGSEIGEDKIKLINEWNYQTQNLICEDSDTVFVPTYDLFKYNTKTYLTIDNFHPDSAGYKAIAERIEQLRIENN